MSIKNVKIETEVNEFELRRWLTQGMTVEELADFARSLGFALSANDQRKFWKQLKSECQRLLEA